MRPGGIRGRGREDAVLRAKHEGLGQVGLGAWAVVDSPRAIKAEVLLSARYIAIEELIFSVRFEIIGPVELAS